MMARIEDDEELVLKGLYQCWIMMLCGKEL